jgi:hypothetical protein
MGVRLQAACRRAVAVKVVAQTTHAGGMEAGDVGSPHVCKAIFAFQQVCRLTFGLRPRPRAALLLPHPSPVTI